MVTTRNLFSGYFPTFDFPLRGTNGHLANTSLPGLRWWMCTHQIKFCHRVVATSDAPIFSYVFETEWEQKYLSCLWYLCDQNFFFCMNVTTTLFFVWFFHVQSGFCEWVLPNTADSWWVQCVFWTFLLTTQCLKCYTAYFYIFSSIMSNCAETCAGGESALWDSFLEWQ